MVELTKTTPELFNTFIEVVSSFQPCTLEQIRQAMKGIWGPVYSAKNFAVEYGFVEYNEKEKRFKLSLQGERLTRLSGNLRNDFLINNIKLPCAEPFLSLTNELQKRKTMSVQEIADFLGTKYPQKKKWTVADKEAISEAFSLWLETLRIAKIDKKTVLFSKGEVKTSGILFFPEMSTLVERYVYDFLTENFNTPHNISNEPYAILEKTNKATDDNDRGDFFEQFIGSVFKRFGFNPRLRDGPKERKSNLNLQRKGGGDAVLFYHFPFQSDHAILHGYAIASEGKAAENAVGSKAVGQARNLAIKIKENYQNYLIHTVVFSQSKFGFDSSGREQAPPEVLHITARTLLCLLELQEKQLEKDLRLITPHIIAKLLEELIKRQKLEPDSVEVVELVKDILGEQ